MKIMFMGTSDFASECLNILSKREHKICAVVSQPDRPKGRGHKMVPTPVHKMAEELSLKVYQPETLKGEAFLPVLEEENPDIIVVVAYGKILPEYVLNFPKHGCINVHGSLLPLWRGAAPIQWSVLNGDEETGITIMYMEKGLDTGDMILVKKTPIGEDETSEELFNRMAVMGGETLVEALKLIEEGKATRTKQDDSLATYASKIEKHMAEIDWSKSAREIKNLIRGMNSWPYAFTYINGAVMKIGSCEIIKGNGSAFGTVISANKKDGFVISCKDGAIKVLTVQFEGKKMMAVSDYFSGNSIEEGIVLGGK